MVTKLTQGNVLEEIVQIVQRYEGVRSSVQHWACEVCGMLHNGAAPDACDSCGVAGALAPRQDVHSEIGNRW